MSCEESEYDVAAADTWYLYLVRTAAGTLYCGITKDVARRFAEHSSGGPRAARALRGRGPLTLEFSVPVGSHGEALRAELRVKKLKKSAKEKLISGESELPG